MQWLLVIVKANSVIHYEKKYLLVYCYCKFVSAYNVLLYVDKSIFFSKVGMTMHLSSC